MNLLQTHRIANKKTMFLVFFYLSNSKVLTEFLIKLNKSWYIYIFIYKQKAFDIFLYADRFMDPLANAWFYY